MPLFAGFIFCIICSTQRMSPVMYQEWTGVGLMFQAWTDSPFFFTWHHDNLWQKNSHVTLISIICQNWDDIDPMPAPFCHIISYLQGRYVFLETWWRHQMETFSAFLVICAGNIPVSGEFPAKRPVTRSFGVFFDLRLNGRLSKHSWGWWLEAPSRTLWRHSNDDPGCWPIPIKLSVRAEKKSLLALITNGSRHWRLDFACFSSRWHRQIVCLLNNMFRLTTKKMPNLRIPGPLCGESISDSHKGSLMHKAFPWHDVFMFVWVAKNTLFDWKAHYDDVIFRAMAPQITSNSTVYSIICWC